MKVAVLLRSDVSFIIPNRKAALMSCEEVVLLKLFIYYSLYAEKRAPLNPAKASGK